MKFNKQTSLYNVINPYKKEVLLKICMNPLIYHYEYEWSFTTIVYVFKTDLNSIFFLYEITWAGKWCHKNERFMICA